MKKIGKKLFYKHDDLTIQGSFIAYEMFRSPDPIYLTLSFKRGAQQIDTIGPITHNNES